MQPDPEAMANVVVTAIKTALAPLQERIATLEQRPMVAAAPEIAPEDIAASVAGLLRKELADLDLPTPRPSTKVVRDAAGAVKFQIEETA